MKFLRPCDRETLRERCVIILENGRTRETARSFVFWRIRKLGIRAGVANREADKIMDTIPETEYKIPTAPV